MSTEYFRLDSPVTRTKNTAGLAWQWQVLVFVLAVGAVLSRRPDALLNPQFFAEDGRIWYTEAYMFGWFQSLLHSQNGYFQTLPRLAASLSLLAPLRQAPLIMNLVGITFQVLPVNFLLSARCSNWGSLGLRGVMTAAYIALPNTMELDATVEEGQWHLALLASLLVFSLPPRRIAWRALDVALVFLSGVTGPFCILLAPCAAVYWWLRRERHRLILFATVAAAAAIQLTAILRTAAETRPKVVLGASPQLFAQLLGGQVYLGAVLGQRSAPVHHATGLLALAALAGTAVVAYTLLKARLELRLFVSFAAMVFAVSLVNPMVSMTTPQWQTLHDAAGVRYWFFPMLAFVWSVVWCASPASPSPIRVGAVCGLLSMLIGITGDWRYPPYPDFHFPQYAARFEVAAPGALIAIPIFPQGWVMRLTKKGGNCRNNALGYIDQPAANSQVSGITHGMGWAAGAEPVKSASLYLDDKPWKTLPLTDRRPDVEQVYPNLTHANKGWQAELDFSQVPPGKHHLELRAAEPGGCETELAEETIERVP